jgi:hypothetical protein
VVVTAIGYNGLEVELYYGDVGDRGGGRAVVVTAVAA